MVTALGNHFCVSTDPFAASVTMMKSKKSRLSPFGVSSDAAVVVMSQWASSFVVAALASLAHYEHLAG